MGQYCFDRWRLSHVVLSGPGVWAVGRPALHGGPVLLRAVRANTLLIKRCLVYFCKFSTTVVNTVLETQLQDTWEEPTEVSKAAWRTRW